MSEARTNTDILYGAAEISTFLSQLVGREINRKLTYHWIRTGRIPAGRIGETIIASRAKIHEQVARVAAGEVESIRRLGQSAETTGRQLAH